MPISRFLIPAVAALCCAPLTSQAATVYSGTLAATYDQTIFGLLGLTTNDHFDQATSLGLTQAQLLATTTAGSSTDVWAGLPFAVNGFSVLGAPGRAFQATTFSYDPGNLTGTATGQIGLGGVTRWNGTAGMLAAGDYGLSYVASRAAGVYSGWKLDNYFGFPANVFDLANVTTTVTPTGFTLSGDLVPNADSFLALYQLAGTDMGNFTFTASNVPEPTAGMLSVAAALVLTSRRRRR